MFRWKYSEMEEFVPPSAKVEYTDILRCEIFVIQVHKNNRKFRRCAQGCCISSGDIYVESRFASKVNEQGTERTQKQRHGPATIYCAAHGPWAGERVLELDNKTICLHTKTVNGRTHVNCKLMEIYEQCVTCGKQRYRKFMFDESGPRKRTKQIPQLQLFAVEA